MSLLPSGVCVTPGNNYFATKDTEPGTPSSGLAYNITWANGPSNTLVGGIPVPGMTQANVVQCTLQPGLVGATQLTDCENNWLVASAAGTNQILVYIATQTQPVDNAHYGVAWSVIA